MATAGETTAATQASTFPSLPPCPAGTEGSSCRSPAPSPGAGAAAGGKQALTHRGGQRLPASPGPLALR